MSDWPPVDTRIKTRCFYCGVTVVRSRHNGHIPNRASTDHLLPRSEGGNSAEDNLVTACVECNCDKGEMTLDEYRVLLAMRCNDFREDFMATLLAEAAVAHPFHGDAQGSKP